MNPIEFIESVTGFKYYSGNSPVEYIYDYFDAFFEYYQNYYSEDLKLPSYKIRNFVHLIRSGISINELIKQIDEYWESKNEIIRHYQGSALHAIHEISKFNNYKWFTDLSPISVFHLSGKKIRKLLKEYFNIEIKDYQLINLKTVSDLVNFIDSTKKINSTEKNNILDVVNSIQNYVEKQNSTPLQSIQNIDETKESIEETECNKEFLDLGNIIFNEE